MHRPASNRPLRPSRSDWSTPITTLLVNAIPRSWAAAKTRPNPCRRQCPAVRPPLVLIAIVVLVLLLAGGVWWLVAHRTTAVADQPLPVVEQAPPRPNPAPDAKPVRWQPAATTGPALSILDKKWFTIGYRDAYRSPAWVCYDLSGPIVNHGLEPKRPTFATDFDTSAHVSSSDYSAAFASRIFARRCCDRAKSAGS